MNHTDYSVTPADQEWYGTGEWQSGECEAETQVASGDTRMYYSTEEFLAYVENPRRVVFVGVVRAFISRHKAMMGVIVVCGLGVVSSVIPPLAYILNVMLLIAVIVATAGFVALFSYLIGTSLRAALRARRGESR